MKEIKHLVALAIKFIMIGLISVILLPLLTSLNITQSLVVAAVVTILAYIVGDLLILDRTNNTIATIADAGLALLTIWEFNNVYVNPNISWLDAAIVSVVIGVGEFVFHKYVQRAVLP